MVLVNGACGIGTGWATSIPPFSPIDIIENIKNKLQTGRGFKRMGPWFRGFKGDVVESETGFYTKGVAKVTQGGKVRITELPI
jgi:DNA topoisomerase-2